MPVTVNWSTQVIYVTQSYLTPLGGGVYELDVDQFRLDLKDLEDDEDGMVFPDTHRHTTETTLSGVTYARFIEIINGYTVEFEDGIYSIKPVGANHNIADVKVLNSASLLTFNSAGLIVAGGGGGGSDQYNVDQGWASDVDDSLMRNITLLHKNGLYLPLDVTATMIVTIHDDQAVLVHTSSPVSADGTGMFRYSFSFLPEGGRMYSSRADITDGLDTYTGVVTISAAA